MQQLNLSSLQLAVNFITFHLESKPLRPKKPKRHDLGVKMSYDTFPSSPHPQPEMIALAGARVQLQAVNKSVEAHD